MGFFGENFGKFGYFVDAVNPLSDDFLENPREAQNRDEEERDEEKERANPKC